MKWTLQIVAGCVLSLAVTGCNSPWLVSGVRSPIRLLASHPCPVSLGASDGVSNPGVGEQLALPNPTTGLICRYAPPSPFGAHDLAPGSIYAQVWLTPSQAVRLAAVIDTISTAVPTGATSCPAGFDSTSLIVFEYTGAPDIDLWFEELRVPDARQREGEGVRTGESQLLRAFRRAHPAMGTATVLI